MLKEEPINGSKQNRLARKKKLPIINNKKALNLICF